MPAVIIARSTHRRRAMSEINMVPFIDVMLVLLIIFMVGAPLIATGIVDLPSVGKAKQRPAKPIEIIVAADERLRMRTEGGEVAALALAQLATRVRQAQAGNADTPVVISADRNVKYEQVVKVMDVLQKAGVQRIGLIVKQGG
jgi:biopolymer transport protein TolR